MFKKTNQTPEFCAMMKATLLVPGWILMNPHSLWRGFLLSAWNALNLKYIKSFLTVCLWVRTWHKNNNNNKKASGLFCYLHKIDHGLSYMWEMKSLCVTKRRDGGEGSLSWLIRLPGSQEPVQRQHCGVQLRCGNTDSRGNKVENIFTITFWCTCCFFEMHVSF